MPYLLKCSGRHIEAYQDTAMRDAVKLAPAPSSCLAVIGLV